MHIVHHTRIEAPIDIVFGLARDVEGWTRLLREYRWCRVLERTPTRLVFAMGGWIRGWPARWTARQQVDPALPRISFHHTRGITRGMDVEWRFSPDGRGVRVELVHDLVMRWPIIGRMVSDLIVGPIFIDFIARKTLQAVKHEAERAAAIAGGPLS
jgi:ribosome-associated toxin RatA of RatAB toxin-antitoxin module